MNKRDFWIKVLILSFCGYVAGCNGEAFEKVVERPVITCRTLMDFVDIQEKCKEYEVLFFSYREDEENSLHCKYTCFLANDGSGYWISARQY